MNGTKCGRYTLNALTSNVLVSPVDDWSHGSPNDPLICINSRIMQDFMDRSLKKPKVEWTFSPLGVTYFEHLHYAWYSYNLFIIKYIILNKDVRGTEFSRVRVHGYASSTIWEDAAIYLWQYVKLISQWRPHIINIA